MKAKISEHFRAYWRLYLSGFVCAFCIAVSLGGVWYAIYISHTEGDGQRGGAIADAVALGVIFLSQSYASGLYDLFSALNPIVDKELGDLDRPAVHRIVVSEIKRFEALLDADAKLLRLQNILLAIATFVGTAFWGFGDLWARLYIPVPPPQICHACICKLAT